MRNHSPLGREALARAALTLASGLCAGALCVWLLSPDYTRLGSADGDAPGLPVPGAVARRTLSGIDHPPAGRAAAEAGAGEAAAFAASEFAGVGPPLAHPVAPAKPQQNTSGSNTTFLAVFTRYDEDISWLSDNRTGIVDNSTGTPSWIMPIAIYQAADIGLHGRLPWPVFPGLPANATLENCNPLPAWPAWAKGWVASMNHTRFVVIPGSSREAERAAKLRFGIKWSNVEAKREAKLHMGLPDDHPDLPDPEIVQEEADLLDSGSKFAAGTGAASAAEVLKPLPEEANGTRSSVVLNANVSALSLHIVPNRAAEAMGYLAAIIENYHSLPDVMLFLHAHRTSWHTVLGQDWTLRRLAAYPPAKLNSVGGYLPLGCQERWNFMKNQLFPTEIDANWASPNGPRWHEALAARYAQAWREHLGEAYGMPVPDYVKMPFAATFAATKEALLRHPLSFYEDMRAWLLRTHIESKWLAIVMEFQWHIMLTNQTVVNPSQEECLCNLYSVCSLPSEM